MNIQPVPNNDQCGRCKVRHGGNNHLCSIHGAVTKGCCEKTCQKKDYAFLQGCRVSHPDAPDNGYVHIAPIGIVHKKDIPIGYKKAGKKTHGIRIFTPGKANIEARILDRKWQLGQLPEYGSHSPSLTARLKGRG